MRPDSGIQADAFDDLPGIQAAHLRVGIQLIEKADAQRQIGICKKLHRLRFRGMGDQRRDLLPNGAFLQKLHEPFGIRPSFFMIRRNADDDAGRIEIVIQRMALSQKLRTEQNTVRPVFFPNRSSIAHGNRGFDNHDGLRIHPQHRLDHRLHRGGIKIVLLRIVIGRSGNDDEIRLSVRLIPIQSGDQIERFFRKIFLNLLIPDR